MKLKLQSISPLSAAVYKLLLQDGSLTVQEIASKLRIFPHAIYRNVKQLETLGCICHSGKYPARYIAKQPLESVETFLCLYREWFLKTFNTACSPNGRTFSGHIETPNIEFIESRSAMFGKAISDMQSVEKEIDLIISGDETPAEIMLENKRAIERGVSIKMLVQKRNKLNEALLCNWQRIGLEVRVCQPIHARISIYDSDTVYFMSYHPENIGSSTGIRFQYKPFARLMKSLFDKLWKTAEIFMSK